MESMEHARGSDLGYKREIERSVSFTLEQKKYIMIHISVSYEFMMFPLFFLTCEHWNMERREVERNK